MSPADVEAGSAREERDESVRTSLHKRAERGFTEQRMTPESKLSSGRRRPRLANSRDSGGAGAKEQEIRIALYVEAQKSHRRRRRWLREKNERIAVYF
jgi:hypothetical protein